MLGYPDWCNVIYDGDEAVYAYRLAEDYAMRDDPGDQGSKDSKTEVIYKVSYCRLSF